MVLLRSAEVGGVATLAALAAGALCYQRGAGKRRFKALVAKRQELQKRLDHGEPSAGKELAEVEAQIEVTRIADRVPPIYSPGVPQIGGFVHFAADPLGMVRTARKKLGNVFTVSMFGQNITFLVGSDPHKAFFESPDELLDQAPVYKFMTPVFGPGVLYDAPIKRRRQQIRFAAGALNGTLLKSYPPTIAKEAVDYFSAWQEGELFDALIGFSELTILTASSTLHGKEVRDHLCAEVYQYFKEMDKGISPLSVLFPYAPTAAHRQRDKAHRKMIDLFNGVLQGRREKDAKSEAQSEKKPDYLQRLMEATYTDGGDHLKDAEIGGLLIALLFAGQHTSSISLTWTVLFLLEDARKGGKWIERCREELLSLEPEPGAFARGEVPYEKVMQMNTLKNCIKEAVRMFPPLIFLIRQVCKAPLKIGDWMVPVGHNVMVSTAGAMRMEEFFDDPDVYNPGRWECMDKSAFPPYSFIGFGGGVHTCMGESFAFMQIRTVLAVLLSSYDLELQAPLPPADYTAMVVMPKGENFIKVTRRPGGGAPPPPPTLGSSSQATNGAAVDVKSVKSDAKYSWEEIRKHNTEDDCWLVFRGRVFDVSEYMPLHQGGEDSILKWAGKDAASLGDTLGDQHPSEVLSLLERFYIGESESES